MGSFSYDTWLQKINTGKVYSSIFSTIFAHIEALLMHIQAYSGIFGTLCNLRIFTTLPYSKSWHAQNHVNL